ncbi:hypothetical protein Talka_00368 [Tepidimonas alkaliphilus]|uniref:Uncharacterized protein n=1 Tax=Tepidimonas alkaliphilus TaxID=2588942 RepID=A0A554WDM4_9BURK|nr:hypothetical protein [Tepidimonas alkaliphilus]TSE21688.1 hypothetical protein Talka_00368 [Tepidimonas alkaliphilus]
MTPEMLYALRDQAGVPAHPALFLILGVLTFALHIAAVQVMLGTSALTLRGAFSAETHWRRLAAAMLTTAKVAVSVAIVLGVAPLLFVQVIYDPFWYTSNVLSAWWVIGFIVALIGGYLAMYMFYWRNHDLVRDGARGTAWMAVSVALLLLVGFIVHSLTNQMLFPQDWMQWYAPGGAIDPSGRSLHYWNLPRFGFFIALSAPVTGAWLYAYRRYLIGAGEADAAYLDWVRALAQRLMVAGGAAALLLGTLWMVTLPATMAWFATSPWVWLALAALLAVVALPLALGPRLDRGFWGYGIFGAGALALIVVGAAREALRYGTLLGAHGYNALDYRVQMDWYSTVLFFVTFAVVGGVTLGYLLTVAWQAGQQREGAYTPGPRVTALGQWSVRLLVLWTLAYFGVGLWVWLR